MIKSLLNRLHQTSPQVRHQLAEGTQLLTAQRVRNVATASSATWLSLATPAYMLWGANTDVGKTLVSAGLAAAANRSKVWSNNALPILPSSAGLTDTVSIRRSW